MQFKTLAFLSILSILLFTGCDSKDNNESAKEETTVQSSGLAEDDFLEGNEYSSACPAHGSCPRLPFFRCYFGCIACGAGWRFMKDHCQPVVPRKKEPK